MLALVLMALASLHTLLNCVTFVGDLDILLINAGRNTLPNSSNAIVIDHLSRLLLVIITSMATCYPQFRRRNKMTHLQDFLTFLTMSICRAYMYICRLHYQWDQSPVTSLAVAICMMSMSLV